VLVSEVVVGYSEVETLESEVIVDDVDELVSVVLKSDVVVG